MFRWRWSTCIIIRKVASLPSRTMAERTMSSSSSSDSVSYQDSMESDSRSPSPTPFEPLQQLLDEYQTLLSSTFDLTGLLPTQPLDEHENEGGRTMTKAEKQNAKKKRRKEREREAKLAEAGVSSIQSKPDSSIGMPMSLRMKRWKMS